MLELTDIKPDKIKPVQYTGIASYNEYLDVDPDIPRPYFGNIIEDENEKNLSNLRRVHQTTAADMYEKLFLYIINKTHSESIEDRQIQSNTLEDVDSVVDKLISPIRYSSIRYTNKLMERIKMLYRDSKYEEPDGKGISEESFKHFFKLLQQNTNLKYPSITLTPDNNIFTRWIDEKGRRLSACFLPNGDVSFVIFKVNPMHPNKKIQINGSTTVDTLLETILPNDVKWIFE